MPNLVDDSDDTFPELAIIIGRNRKDAVSKAIGRDSTKTVTKNAMPNHMAANSTAELHGTCFCTYSESLKASAADTERSKPGRHISKKINADSMLQPFGQMETSPALILKRSKSQSQVFYTRPEAHAELKASGRPSISSATEDGEDSLEDSRGMSDFIVSDSSSLEEYNTDEETQSRPRRSTRRLVRGRKPPGPDSAQKEKSTPASHNQSQQDENAPGSNTRPTRGKDDTNEALQIPNSRSSGMLPKGKPGVTPSSPQKGQRLSLSTKKGTQIPMTPHGPSMDAFWDPDVINEWNEEYSPRKTLKPEYRKGGDGFEIHLPASPSKKNQSIKQANRQESKKFFSSTKHETAKKFLLELDEKVTSGKVSEMAAMTGGIDIIWSKKLNTTAGRASWRREAMRSITKGVDGKSQTNITYCHYASIELAEKVIDDEERLLNVVAHEFCHLANFMVSGIRNNPHGKEFKNWAAKCTQQFSDRGIRVTTKHSYVIDYKYVWECTNCGNKFKRHSKSIDPSNHQCGSCKSKLVQIKPVPRSNSVANEYQLFVKENLRRVKGQNPGSPQKQIMTMVGQMYRDYKTSKKAGNREDDLDYVSVDSGEDIEPRGQSPGGSQIDQVMRELNSLDLSSPGHI